MGDSQKRYLNCIAWMWGIELYSMICIYDLFLILATRMVFKTVYSKLVSTFIALCYTVAEIRVFIQIPSALILIFYTFR